MKNKLPEGWKIKPFEECLERESSSNELKIPQSDFLDNGKYPIIDQGDNFIAGYTNDKNKILHEDRPVIVFGDHTLILKYVDFPFALGADGVKVLVPKSEIDPKYFYYYLKSLKIESHGYSRHYKFLKEKFVSYPPLPAQKLIVSILEKAESLKHKRKEADKLTKEYLQSVFYEMFGDPKPNGNKFSSIKLGEIARITMGGTPSTAIDNYWENGTINWMKSGDIKGDFIFSVPNKITISGLDNSNTELYPIGTVVIALNGQGKTRGTTAVLRIETTSNQSVSGIILDNKKMLPNYLLFNLKMRYQELRSITGDNDRSGLNLTILRNLQIPLPPLPLQQKFASIVEHVEKLKEKQAKSKEEIGLMFDSLMQKAFKGELVR